MVTGIVVCWTKGSEGSVTLVSNDGVSTTGSIAEISGQTGIWSGIGCPCPIGSISVLSSLSVNGSGAETGSETGDSSTDASETGSVTGDSINDSTANGSAAGSIAGGGANAVATGNSLGHCCTGSETSGGNGQGDSTGCSITD